MTLFDLFKRSSPQQRSRRVFKKMRKKTTIAEIKKSQMHGMIPPNAPSEDEDPAGTGEFGLTKTNPIPVYGIENIAAYMDKLRYRFDSKISAGSHTFNPIEFSRNGSTTSPNIIREDFPMYGNIDEYSIYKFEKDDRTDSDKEKLAVIYINAYSLKTSNKVPKGFYHRDEIDILRDGKLLLEVAKSYSK